MPRAFADRLPLDAIEIRQRGIDGGGWDSRPEVADHHLAFRAHEFIRRADLRRGLAENRHPAEIGHVALMDHLQVEKSNIPLSYPVVRFLVVRPVRRAE